MAKQKVPAESENDEARNEKKISVAAVADKNRSRAVHDGARNGRDTVQRAQLANLRCRVCGIQEGVTQNGLNNSQRNDDRGKNQVRKKEPAQLLLGIEERITH